MIAPLTNSPSLVEVPRVDSAHKLELDAEDSPYANWGEVLEHNAGILDFLLKPGDYRKWGTLRVLDRAGNSPDRPTTIRYHDADDETLHPVKRPKMARIESFSFEGTDTKNWLLHGLTIRCPLDTPSIRFGASNITVDYCLVEYGVQYSIRIREASHCTIQRCVIRNSFNQNENRGKGDSSGIAIGNTPGEVLAIKLLDNEIYNVGDGIQLTDYKPDPTLPVEVLMEGNDVYLEPSRYIGETNTTWDENAIDIKAGSDGPDSTVIRNNRMWGYRLNAEPTARGEILVLQRYCRNVVVENNIMGDAPRGMRDIVWPNTVAFPITATRNIAFRRNQFYDIHPYAADEASAMTRPVTAGMSFVDNYFARSSFLGDATPPPGYGDPPPAYTGNLLVEVDCLQRDLANMCVEPSWGYDPALNTRFAFAPHGYDTYERKRWTGPEVATGAKPTGITLPL